MGGPGVLLDLVAPQSPSYRGRGIARHGLAFAEALVERHPGLVEGVLVHPELPPADGMEALEASGKLMTEVPDSALGGIFHVTSPFEPELEAATLWPVRASRRRMRLAVTVYDLIPDVFPDMYLQDPGLRRRWRCGRELVRCADHVFAISGSARHDVVSMLGVPARRVSVIGSGVDGRFSPGPRADAARLAHAGVEGLGERYVVCNGAIDPRKNMGRLVESLARLPSDLGDVQVVLVCRATASERNHFMVMADRLGVGGRVLMPGYVGDDLLVALYRSCAAAAFPSLYEGYGLPVIEARACGALVVAGDNSSLREITPPMARFDALDVDAMAAVLARVVGDEGYRRELAVAQAGPLPDWGEVADAAAEGYRALLARDRATAALVPGWRRPTAAVVMPGEGRGRRDGDEVADGLEATAGGGVDRFAAAGSPPGGLLPASALGRLGRWRGGYDRVVTVTPPS